MGIMARFPSGNLRVVCEYVCVVCDVYECVYCVDFMLSVSMYDSLSLSLVRVGTMCVIVCVYVVCGVFLCVYVCGMCEYMSVVFMCDCVHAHAMVHIWRTAFGNQFTFPSTIWVLVIKFSSWIFSAPGF